MTEPSEAPEWTLSDAWVLAAVSSSGRAGVRACGRAGRLADLIGAADAINHAIPTREALARGIGALRAAGLVTVDEDRILLTPEGNRIRNHWKRGMFNWGPTLLPVLATLPRTEELFPLTDEDVERAYREYTQRI